MALRYATEEDLIPLLDLEDMSFDSDRLKRDDFLKLLKKNKKTTHLLIWGDIESTYGYILLLTNRRGPATINSIAVHPLCWGKGAGASLIEEAIKIAKELGYRSIQSYIRVDNTHSINRHKKSGFKIKGTYANYYEDGCDAIKYSREI